MPDPTKIIVELDALHGIPSRFESNIHDAVAKLDFEKKLLVALYFMSDLSPEDHTFAKIEENLRPLHKQPETFKTFRQTCIKNFVYSGSSLFENPQRGRWMNSEDGNRVAKSLLATRNIMVSK